MRRFALQRDGADIAQGLEFNDGRVAVTYQYDTVDALTAAVPDAAVVWAPDRSVQRAEIIAAVTKAVQNVVAPQQAEETPA